MVLKEQVAEILKSKMALERCDPDVMPYFTDYYWIPKDEVANLAQEILKLFKAEVDKLTVIDDDEAFSDAQWEYIKRYKELFGITLNFPLEGWLRQDCNRKAQLQHDKQTLLDLMGE